jgi:hypothetical protein
MKTSPIPLQRAIRVPPEVVVDPDAPIEELPVTHLHLETDVTTAGAITLVCDRSGPVDGPAMDGLEFHLLPADGRRLALDLLVCVQDIEIRHGVPLTPTETALRRLAAGGDWDLVALSAPTTDAERAGHWRPGRVARPRHH